MSYSKPLVIVHGNCMDGLGAAWAANQFLFNIEFYVAHYGTTPPDVTGRRVYIFDFSYPRDVLIEMHRVAEYLIVVDHHDSAERELAGLDFAVFDQSKSGAVLAWEFFAPHNGNRPLPTLLRYIQDRDLWQWALPNSREFNEYLRDIVNVKDAIDVSLRTLDDVNAGILDDDMDAFVNQGALLLAAKEKLIDEVVATHFLIDIALSEDVMIAVPAAFCPPRICSEVGQRLAALSPVNVCAGLAIGGLSHGKFGLSFRSLKGSDMAQKLAIHFGGGGHRQAAGAGITPVEFSKLMLNARNA